MIEKRCRKCGDVLNDDNWSPSYRKRCDCICKRCSSEQTHIWVEANPEKYGHRSMSENRECAAFLGVHVAERVLRHVFKDVEVMPYGNPGYDIICNRGKLIDSKAACMAIPIGSLGKWQFLINRNKIADYFVLLAFNNRKDIDPLYCWMIPGDVINHLRSTSISVSTIDKWDEYRLDINRVVDCCDALR